MVMRRKESKTLAADEAHSDSFHHFFAALIQTYPTRGYIYDSSFFMEICYGYPALDGIIRVHGPEKIERHLVCDKIENAADFRRQRGGEKPLCHQTALFVGLDVMNTLVSGKSAKLPDILFGECAFPYDDVANGHRFVPQYEGEASSDVIKRSRSVSFILSRSHRPLE
jgi:hypothetical protein